MIYRFVFLLALMSANPIAHSAPLTFDCGTSTLALDERGFIVSLKTDSGKALLLKAPDSPIFRLKTFLGESLEDPRAMTSTKKDGATWITLEFSSSTAEIRVEEKAGYLTLELISIAGDAAELVFWGPYHVVIRDTIAESLGAVYDAEHAVGIMALNLKTCGGYKTNSGSNRGNVAVAIGGGALLQAHARDRTRPGVFEYGSQKNIHIRPLKGETPLGTKIAIYTTSADTLVDLVATIEKAEGLPHPEHKGQWLKTSRYSTSSKLISNFKEAEIDSYLDLAEAAGISCVYHSGIFQSWGTFEPRRHQFPSGVAGVKACVAKAKARGMTLGSHTLSNFLHPFDPLVSPVPTAGLLTAGETVLGRDLDSTATEVVLADDALIESYDAGSRGQIRAVQIGNELIEFSARSESRPWRLTGCKRGAFKTTPVRHAKGEGIAKLVSHAYHVFLPDIALQDRMASNLARFFNESGLERISFDGLEGCLRAGHGRYACERFVARFYDEVSNKSIISNSSIMPHFYWHNVSNQSWGEPWGDGFRSAMLDHRLNSQRFLVRNKLPSKLGQYRMAANTGVEDINWIMGLCAGLDSGVDFYMEPSIYQKNPRTPELLATIKRWETARMKGVFSEAEKAELRKPSTIYELVPQGDGVRLSFVKDWVKEAKQEEERKMTLMANVFGNTVGVQLSDDYAHVNKPREPGQPTAAMWTLENIGRPQPLQFVMRAPAANTQVIKDAYFKVGALALPIPFSVKGGEYVVAKGDGQLTHHAAPGNTIAEATVTDLQLVAGKNDISFNTHRDGDEPGPQAVVNFRTQFSGYSLTTGKPVTCSHNEHEGALVNDGRMKDSKHNWHAAAGDTPWWQVDLEALTRITRIVVVPYHNGPRYYQFTVQTSTDGQAWATVIDHSSNTALVPKDGYSFDLEPADIRHIRVNMLKHSLNGAVHLVEVMAF